MQLSFAVKYETTACHASFRPGLSKTILPWYSNQADDSAATFFAKKSDNDIKMVGLISQLSNYHLNITITN